MKKLSPQQSDELFQVIKRLNDVHVAKQVQKNKVVETQLYDSYIRRQDYEYWVGTHLKFRVRFSLVEGSKREECQDIVIQQECNVTELQPMVPQCVVADEKPKGRGKGKKPAKQVTSVALDDDLIEALNVRAEREERTVSALIRLAIKHYLECVK